MLDKADCQLRKEIDKKFPLDKNWSRGGHFSSIDKKVAINLDEVNLPDGPQQLLSNHILINQVEFNSFALGQGSQEISEILETFFGK